MAVRDSVRSDRALPGGYRDCGRGRTFCHLGGMVGSALVITQCGDPPHTDERRHSARRRKPLGFDPMNGRD